MGTEEKVDSEAAAKKDETPKAEEDKANAEAGAASVGKAAKAKAKKGPKKVEVDPTIFKPATVDREDNLTYDLKHMAAYDIAPLPSKTEFMAHTRDSVQLLVNKFFTLDRDRVEEGTVVILPNDEVFRLPRQKPIPKAKAPTRWQKFMEERNMDKRKRSRLVYDEVTDDWVPRWGYKSIKKNRGELETGIYEVKSGEDSNVNPFERMKAEQKLKIMKQKMREVRNKVESMGGSMKAATPDLADGKVGSGRGKEGLKEAIKRAQTASGSRGKFDRMAPNEATNLNKKRQRMGTPMTGEAERERYMKQAGKVLSGATIDKDKAAKVGRQQAEGISAKKKVAKGSKGTPGAGRRSKSGGNKGSGRPQKGRKIKP